MEEQPSPCAAIGFVPAACRNSLCGQRIKLRHCQYAGADWL